MQDPLAKTSKGIHSWGRQQNMPHLSQVKEEEWPFFPWLSHSIIPVVQHENFSSWFDILSIATLLSGISVCVVRGICCFVNKVNWIKKKDEKGQVEINNCSKCSTTWYSTEEFACIINI